MTRPTVLTQLCPNIRYAVRTLQPVHTAISAQKYHRIFYVILSDYHLHTRRQYWRISRDIVQYCTISYNIVRFFCEECVAHSLQKYFAISANIFYECAISLEKTCSHRATISAIARRAAIAAAGRHQYPPIFSNIARYLTISANIFKYFHQAVHTYANKISADIFKYAEVCAANVNGL